VLASTGFSDIPVVEVPNTHFGGNTGVAGLMTFADIQGVLRARGRENVYLLPDVCLNDGVFLDGATVGDLSKEFDIEVIATSGTALRQRLDAARKENSRV
jgi:NifB/MoaA-like Fe-S oxidoreductase